KASRPHVLEVRNRFRRDLEACDAYRSARGIPHESGQGRDQRARREVRMKVISLSVGLPQEVDWHGRTVLTSIFNTPVGRRLRVTTLNLEGDEQSDLTVHGGVDKAVYVYPSEHYASWRQELPGMDLPWAIFGENLTTEGLLENVRIGDRFRIGSAEF